MQDILKLMYHEAAKEEIAEMIQKAGPVVRVSATDVESSEFNVCCFGSCWRYTTPSLSEPLCFIDVM